MTEVSFEEKPGRIVTSPLLDVKVFPVPVRGLGGNELQFAGVGVVVASDRSLAIMPLNALKYLSGVPDPK
jgi:hypothetical protein